MYVDDVNVLFSCERYGFNVIGRYDICHPRAITAYPMISDKAHLTGVTYAVVLFTSLVDIRA